MWYGERWNVEKLEGAYGKVFVAIATLILSSCNIAVNDAVFREEGGVFMLY